MPFFSQSFFWKKNSEVSSVSCYVCEVLVHGTTRVQYLELLILVNKALSLLECTNTVHSYVKKS